MYMYLYTVHDMYLLCFYLHEHAYEQCQVYALQIKHFIFLHLQLHDT